MVCKTAIEVPSSSSSSRRQSVRMKVTQFRGVAMWAWDVVVDNCAICRNSIMDICIECQADQKSTEDADCSVSLGQCKHAFHSHCITRWLRTRRVCPLDNSEWK